MIRKAPRDMLLPLSLYQKSQVTRRLSRLRLETLRPRYGTSYLMFTGAGLTTFIVCLARRSLYVSSSYLPSQFSRIDYHFHTNMDANR